MVEAVNSQSVRTINRSTLNIDRLFLIGSVPISTACIGKAYKISLARLRAPACNFALRACMHMHSYSTRYPLPVLVLVQLYMNRFVKLIGEGLNILVDRLFLIDQSKI